MRASVVTSSGQPPVFGELQEALIAALGGADVSVDCLAAGDAVHVLIPGAYLPYVHPAAHPAPEQLRRTVLVVTESPGDDGFAAAASLADSAAAVFCLDPESAVALGVPVLKLGFVPGWEGESLKRDIDVAVLGEFSDRRSLAVASVAPVLEGRRARIHLERRPLTPFSDMSTPSKRAKWDLLARTRVLLCVHRGESRGFDWQMAAAALTNGCVVLHEQPSGHGPLVAGRHFECAEFHGLPAALEGLLASPERVERIAGEASSFARADLSLDVAGDALRAAVEVAAAAPPPVGGRARLAVPMPVPPRGPAPAVERLQEGLDEDAMVRSALKQSLLRQRRLERELRGLRAPEAPAGDVVTELARSAASPGSGSAPAAGPAGPPRVSVVVTLFNYAHTIADALRSVALSDLDDVELVLVDDASTDDSLAVARAALDELPWLPGRVVARGANGGLARARNLGVEHARAEYVFVLDADNAVEPAGLRRLADALDGAPDSAFAYGLIRAVGPSGPMGLLSWAPWDPWWLRIDNYIDAMALVRRSALLSVGGYTTTESLYGWEDFELWCNMASRGMSGVLVPEVVASYRAGRQSMISLTTLDTTDAWSDLLDRYEFLREAAA